jgi:hypothetical protein
MHIKRPTNAATNAEHQYQFAFLGLYEFIGV